MQKEDTARVQRNFNLRAGIHENQMFCKALQTNMKDPNTSDVNASPWRGNHTDSILPSWEEMLWVIKNRSRQNIIRNIFLPPAFKDSRGAYLDTVSILIRASVHKTISVHKIQDDYLTCLVAYNTSYTSIFQTPLIVTR